MKKGKKPLWVTILIAIFAIVAELMKTPHSSNTISKIVDGDTLVLGSGDNRVTLRLIGIDTPESKRNKKFKREVLKCGVSDEVMLEMGKKATNFAKRYFSAGEKIKYKSYGKGKYGRELAWIEGKEYNADVIKSGYATVYQKSSQLPKEKLEELNEYQAEAKRKRRGLWRNYKDVMECLSQ